MSFLSGIVKRYIRKLIVNQANKYRHNLDEIDLIIRAEKDDVRIYAYSLRHRNVLNVLDGDEIERILKN